MRAYDVALFVHLLGVITLFAALAVAQRSGARLRAAGSVAEARLWLGLLRPTARMFPAGLVLLLGSGLFMTAGAWTFATPWVAASLVALVAMGAVGGAVQGRRFAAIGRAVLAAGDGPLPAELAHLVRAAGSWVPLFALNGAAIGIVWLMTTKPGWAVSVLVPLGLAGLGAAVGLAAVRRSALPAPDPTPV